MTLILALYFPLLAHGAAFSEYELKAAFVYNFVSFADWPPQAAPGMNICVIGQDPFGQSLDALEGKVIKRKILSVRRIRAITEVRTCRVLFISSSEMKNLPRLLAAVKDLPVLTVADMEDAAYQGVMIGLAIEKQRITFEINATAARQANIVLSSRLLSLARNVYAPP
ncbi:MAG: YfiR family protein [Gammaproteobacteria bacterium]|nr:YfiR family protein [Gammaproteobacteria bacterium]